jgi:hypothetical protein
MHFLRDRNNRQKKNKKYFFCRFILVRSLMVALALNVCSEASAQAYYYFVYEAAKGGDLHIYKALLTLQPDGTATARVQYNAGENNKLYLYELNLADSGIETTSTSGKYLTPSGEPKPWLEEDPGGFLRPRFIFKKNQDSTGYYYTAAGAELTANGESWVPVKMISIEEKSFGELRHNEPFVSSFYFESEPFYQYIFDETTRATPGVRTEKMFLFVVANTNDSSVGKSAHTDQQNVSRLFTSLARDLGIIEVFTVYVSGNNYSKRAVEDALAGLELQQPSSKDIVIFYYSGHGFRLQGDKSSYPRMSFRTAKNKANKEVGENIGLEEVYNRIRALKPGVTLVIGDCCNADIFENPVLGNDMIRPKGGGVLGKFNVESGKKLFLPAAPVAIIVGSVQQGHLSVGHPEIGGYYTHFFTTEMEKNLWGYYSQTLGTFGGKSNVSWLRMLVTAGDNTYQKSIRKQCGKTENDRCIQKAEIAVNPPQ